jgi:endonuclease/exonuclease/phosphatase family metal-dependent hydrolase
MKNSKIATYFFLFIFLSVVSSNLLSQNSSFRVMTFNIRYDNPSDGENSWSNRKEIVHDLLDFYSADIIGFQEVLENQYEDLKAMCPHHNFIGVGRDDGKTQGEFCPIAYNHEKFNEINHGYFWLSSKPDEAGSRGWDAACIRLCSWIELQEKNTLDTLYIFNTHFDHIGVEARLKSAVLLNKKIEEIASSDQIILFGDFNCKPNDRPIRIIVSDTSQHHLKNSIDLCNTEPYGPLGTMTYFTEAGKDDLNIDHIFVPYNAVIFKHQTISDSEKGKFPSDHCPVLIEMSFDILDH